MDKVDKGKKPLILADGLVRIPSRFSAIVEQDRPDNLAPITAHFPALRIRSMRPRRDELDELRPITAHSIDPDRYRSYMVRLWREAPGGPWRCQVSCVGTGQERRFATLAELFEFLVADVADGIEGREGSAEAPDIT